MELNQFIEHTVLKQDATSQQIIGLCEEALQYKFKAVCVPPYFVPVAVNKLGEAGVLVVTVIGFPLGYDVTSAKVEAARRAMEQGADELDMVINLAALKSGNWNLVRADIDSLATMARLHDTKLKVIIESGLLSPKEIEQVCAICADVEVDFVKTSTGFAEKGASVEDVALMRKVLPKKIQIKASGGIRDRAFAEELIAAGATRIGTSSGIKIVTT